MALRAHLQRAAQLGLVDGGLSDARTALVSDSLGGVRVLGQLVDDFLGPRVESFKCSGSDIFNITIVERSSDAPLYIAWFSGHSAIFFERVTAKRDSDGYAWWIDPPRMRESLCIETDCESRVVVIQFGREALRPHDYPLIIRTGVDADAGVALYKWLNSHLCTPRSD
jgi:hypothetical protein